VAGEDVIVCAGGRSRGARAEGAGYGSEDPEPRGLPTSAETRTEGALSGVKLAAGGEAVFSRRVKDPCGTSSCGRSRLIAFGGGPFLRYCVWWGKNPA
jgi:hypothetical protein